MSHTLESIAKLAGVSRGTVSRVVNNQPGVKACVRDKVLRIIKETGYHPNAQARSLAGGKTHNIGVVVFGDEPNFLTHHIFYEVLQGIQGHLTSQDYDLLLFSNRSESDQQYWRRIGDRRKVDGLIVMGEHIREEYLVYYYEKQLPFVTVGKRYFHQIPLVCVTSDYRQGAYSATRHLLEQGRTNIMFLRGYPDTYHEEEKRAGYEQALREAGKVLNPALIIDGQARQEPACAAVHSAMEAGLSFDAVFAGNDLMAFGAIEALKEHNLAVPRDISVVGYDDIQTAAYFTPKLTTVSQNKQLLGAQAAELLMKLLNSELDVNQAHDRLVHNELIVRESSVLLTS
ncbi:LacI family DNA-binding transcriptional regulator [Paenibacillus sp. J2TS4]|uniref:LacI family DNA-binding transcriptional regulator n=1 Tax=Paenibacillus sp. J2TS4 TaxID=2807194 RepID=UPI001B073B8A|nr:LacI family DNA-binding transcriptional regulator [Paenibacillus sp. J2TS4]GIP31882.1 LacI family transcriptional regulator [Paenibacillus sp. J2TS4]